MRTYNITNAFVREGIAKGRIEGLEQGMEKGILKGRVEGLEQGMEKGILKGMERGILKGQQEGLRTGREEGIRETARSMFSKGFSAHDIQDVTGLSDEEIRTVRNGSH